jgi:hypothetical protein
MILISALAEETEASMKNNTRPNPKINDFLFMTPTILHLGMESRYRYCESCEKLEDQHRTKKSSLLDSLSWEPEN